jgi:hypothetical protein
MISSAPLPRHMHAVGERIPEYLREYWARRLLERRERDLT